MEKTFGTFYDLSSLHLFYHVELSYNQVEDLVKVYPEKWIKMYIKKNYKLDENFLCEAWNPEFFPRIKNFLILDTIYESDIKKEFNQEEFFYCVLKKLKTLRMYSYGKNPVIEYFGPIFKHSIHFKALENNVVRLEILKLNGILNWFRLKKDKLPIQTEYKNEWQHTYKYQFWNNVFGFVEYIKDYNFVKEALKIDGGVYIFLPLEYRRDVKIAKLAFERGTLFLYSFVPENLRKNKEFIEYIVKINHIYFMAADLELNKDKDFILNLLKINGFIYKYLVDENIKKDKDVMLEAVRANYEVDPEIVKNFTEEHTNDEDFQKKLNIAYTQSRRGPFILF